VPGNAWGPAWVDWFSGDGFVGWAPLAPFGGAVIIENFVFVHNADFCARNIRHLAINHHFLPHQVIQDWQHRPQGAHRPPSMQDIRRVAHQQMASFDGRPPGSVAPRPAPGRRQLARAAVPVAPPRGQHRLGYAFSPGPPRAGEATLGHPWEPPAATLGTPPPIARPTGAPVGGRPTGGSVMARRTTPPAVARRVPPGMPPMPPPRVPSAIGRGLAASPNPAGSRAASPPAGHLSQGGGGSAHGGAGVGTFGTTH
jgi:hypothetical protein